jgi:HAD superfamily hydrolase (TIGR01450 family)
MNKAVIFDLDGTIYFGDKIVPDALEVIEFLKNQNYEIIFLTNNSTKTRKNILLKLKNFGISTNLSRIYTSSYATARYLSENNINKVFLIGTDDFQLELTSCGIECVNEMECEAVVVGLDLKFNYQDIAKALLAVNNGAKIIASNIDRNFPIEKGILRPGTNAIAAALIGCSGKNIDFVVGKPNTYLLKSIINDFQLNKEKIWVVGDSLESDIAMANSFDCKSFLVHKNNNSLKDFIKVIR